MRNSVGRQKVSKALMEPFEHHVVVPNPETSFSNKNLQYG